MIRVVSADTREFTARVSAKNAPALGELLKTTVGPITIFGVLVGMSVPEDALARQLADAPDDIVAQTRELMSGNAGMYDIRVLMVGHQQGRGSIKQMLPPAPPLAMEAIEKCAVEDRKAFTSSTLYLRFLAQESTEATLAHLAVVAPEQPGEFFAWKGRVINTLTETMLDLQRLFSLLQLLDHLIETPEGKKK